MVKKWKSSSLVELFHDYNSIHFRSKNNLDFALLLSSSIMAYISHRLCVAVSINLTRYRIITYYKYNYTVQENLLWQSPKEAATLFVVCLKDEFDIEISSEYSPRALWIIIIQTKYATTTTAVAGRQNKHIGIRNEQVGQMFKLKHFVADPVELLTNNQRTCKQVLALLNLHIYIHCTHALTHML